MSVLNRDVNIDRFWQDPGSSVDTLPEPKENKQERGARWEGWAEGVHTVQKKDEVTWQRRVHSLYNSAICLREASSTTLLLGLSVVSASLFFF